MGTVRPAWRQWPRWSALPPASGGQYRRPQADRRKPVRSPRASSAAGCGTRPAPRDDAIDQELGGRHVAVLRGGRQHRLKHRFNALRGERVEARPSGFGERDGLSLRASSSAGRDRNVDFGRGFSHVRADLDTQIKYALATTGASPLGAPFVGLPLHVPTPYARREG